MNTLTRNTRIAKRKAKDIAKLRNAPVWLHFASTLTYYIDYIPDWWTPKQLADRKAAGEVIEPEHVGSVTR